MGNRAGGACLEELERSASVAKATSAAHRTPVTTPTDGTVSLIGWLTTSVTDTTMALVGHGALPESRQLAIWNSGFILSPNPPKRWALALTQGLMGKGRRTGQARNSGFILRVSALLTATVWLLSVAACGEEQHPSSPPAIDRTVLAKIEVTVAEQKTATVAPTATATPSPTATAAASPSPTPSPLSGKIAFASDRDGDHEIYVMNADGSNLTRLTDNSAMDQQPQWSPDGGKVVFSSNRDEKLEIYVMVADGSNVSRLTDSPDVDESSDWSPDGTRIAFDTFRDGNQEIYVMNSGGSNQVNLTNTSGHEEGHPSWSPDGSKIAFVFGRGANSGIYVMDADGSNRTLLADSPIRDTGPSWSPKGNKIAFWSRRGFSPNEFGRPQPNAPDIYVIDTDGFNETRLTSHVGWDFNQVWSPDGSNIIFVNDRDGNNEIYVMNADGTNPVPPYEPRRV